MYYMHYMYYIISNVNVIFISFCVICITMPSKKDKGGTHSFRVSKDMEKWIEAKIASHELGSWTHALEWGLELLKEKLEK